MKLLGIARVSTQSQAADERFGFARQEESILRVAVAHGIDPDSVPIVKVVVSGTSLDLTPEWMDKILPVLGDPETHVVVDHQDRLVRSDIGSTEIGVLLALRETNTVIYTPHGKIDLHDPQDAMIAAILAAVAGYERHRIRVRSEAGKRAAARAGHYPEASEKLPLGIVYDRETRSWAATPDAEMIRRAFALYAEGHGVNEIARRVGHPISTVHYWLTAVPLYGGLLQYKDITARVMGGPGQPPAIIDPTIWERVQRRVKGATHKFRQGRTDKADIFPYSGFLHVKEEVVEVGRFPVRTQHRMRGRTEGKYQPRYWCPDDSCGIATPLAAAINQGVDTYLTQLSRDGDYAASLRAHVGMHSAHLQEGLDVAQANLMAVDERLRRLADLYVDGKISRNHHDQRRATLDRERGRAQAAVETLTSAAREGVTTSAVEEVIAGLRCFQMSWSGVEKRQWLRHYRVVITISRAGIESINLRVPGSGALTLSSPESLVMPGETTVVLVDADGLPVFFGGGFRSWAELGVGDPWNAANWRRASSGLMTTAQAAEILGVHEQTLVKWTRQGRVPRPQATEPRGRATPRLRWKADDIEAARNAMTCERTSARKAKT